MIENKLPEITDISQIKDIRVTTTAGASCLMTPDKLADLMLAKISADASKKQVLGELVVKPAYPKNSVVENQAYKIVARMSKYIKGCFYVNIGQQDSYYNYTAIVNIRCSGAAPAIDIFYLFKSGDMNFYYRKVGDEIEIAVKDIGKWTHTQSVSFHPDISAVAENIDSIDGFTALN